MGSAIDRRPRLMREPSRRSDVDRDGRQGEREAMAPTPARTGRASAGCRPVKQTRRCPRPCLRCYGRPRFIARRQRAVLARDRNPRRYGQLGKGIGEQTAFAKRHSQYVPAGKQTSSDARDEAGSRPDIRVAESAVAQQRLDPAPFAASCDARVQLASRLARGGSVVPALLEDCAPAEDGGAGASSRDGSRFLDLADPTGHELGEFPGRHSLESRWTREGQRDGVGHRSLFSEEMLWP